MILSICICTLEKRIAMLSTLLFHLNKQIKDENEVEIIVCSDKGQKTTGEKRNILYQMAKGDYICTVDDDDWVPDYYVYEILKALTAKPDAVAMNGTMTFNGQFHGTWDISMYNPYTESKSQGRMHFLRFHNHLSPIKREIVLKYPFPNKRLYEDYDFAKAIHDAQAIKSEVKIAKPMYEYRYSNSPDKHK